MRSGFPGFPPEAVTFYRGLARHNTREWFQPRKTVYDEKVKAPMVELVTELNRALMAFAPDYVTDAHKAIYRIYRDTRFSPDKTPYKTQIAASDGLSARASASPSSSFWPRSSGSWCTSTSRRPGGRSSSASTACSCRSSQGASRSCASAGSVCRG